MFLFLKCNHARFRSIFCLILFVFCLQVSAEDFLNLENEKKTTLDIRVIRRETAETDSQEMKTCMTSHPDEQDFDQGEQTTPEKGLDIDDDETKC